MQPNCTPCVVARACVELSFKSCGGAISHMIWCLICDFWGIMQRTFFTKRNKLVPMRIVWIPSCWFNAVQHQAFISLRRVNKILSGGRITHDSFDVRGINQCAQKLIKNKVIHCNVDDCHYANEQSVRCLVIVSNKCRGSTPGRHNSMFHRHRKLAHAQISWIMMLTINYY